MLFRTDQSSRRTYRSRASNLFLVRIGGPLLLVMIAILLFGKDYPTLRFLPAVPLLLAALLGTTVANVEVSDSGIRYRRLARWTTVPKKELVSARSELPGLVGSLQLRRYVFPWGRLYFVLDAVPVPFGKSRSPLLHTLTNCCSKTAEAASSAGD